MGFYDDMQKVATELLTEFNQGEIFITIVEQGAFDGKPWKPYDASTSYVEVKGVVKGVSSKYITRGLAIEGDIEVTIAVPVGGDLPNMNSSVFTDSGAYKIISIEPVPANGTPVIVKMIARKA